MQEKLDRLYKEYIKDRLDLIFSDNSETGLEYDNPNKVYEEESVALGAGSYSTGELFNAKFTYDERTRRYYLCYQGVQSHIWFHSAHYYNGHSCVEKNGKKNYIYTNGELLGGTWFDDVSSFINGYAGVKLNNKWNLIDFKGHLVSKVWYDDVRYFCEGFAPVKRKNKWNFINTNGELISKLWFDDVQVFVKGCARVEIDGKWNYINTNGELISKESYDEVSIFKNGFAAVKKDNKWNFINKSWKLVCKDTWYDELKEFKHGIAGVKKDGKWNIIDTQGNVLFDTWYDKIDYYNYYGYIRVVKDGKYTFVDKNGKLLRDVWYDVNYSDGEINSSFYRVYGPGMGDVISFFDYMHGYQFRKTIFGYQCFKDKDQFKVKYEPIAIYGNRFVLCYYKDKSTWERIVVLFDRKNNEYKRLGEAPQILIGEHFLFVNKKVYFMYEDEMMDITEYYYEHLRNKDKIRITKGLSILSKTDFFCNNEEEIRKKIAKEKEEDRKKLEEEKKNVQQQKLQEAKEQEELEQQRNRREYADTLNGIKVMLKKLAVLQQKTGDHRKIIVDDLLITVDEHKEINPLYINLEMLRFIDFSVVDLRNVKMTGIDFRGCNINLDPQTVYNKDLSNSNFEGLHIDTFMDFTGVDIRGSKFSEDNDPRTVDFASSSFAQALYDDNTTYNGISFVKLYGECPLLKNKLNK